MNAQPRAALAFPARAVFGSTDTAVGHRMEGDSECSNRPRACGTESVAAVERVELGLGGITESPRPNPARGDAECPRYTVVAIGCFVGNDDGINIHPRPDLSSVDLLLRGERSRQSLLPSTFISGQKGTANIYDRMDRKCMLSPFPPHYHPAIHACDVSPLCLTRNRSSPLRFSNTVSSAVTTQTPPLRASDSAAFAFNSCSASSLPSAV